MRFAMIAVAAAAIAAAFMEYSNKNVFNETISFYKNCCRNLSVWNGKHENENSKYMCSALVVSGGMGQRIGHRIC